jgi:His-Xaa-Ser system protein HxsD
LIVPIEEVVVQFDCATQSIGPLREAAYRLIPKASCVIEPAAGKFVCRLQPKATAIAQPLDDQGLRQHFTDLVTDENLREKISAETSQIRDVIMALAFGALVNENPAS